MYEVKAITRFQKFLNAIAGNGEAPEPITNLEKLLANIAEKINSSSAAAEADPKTQN